MNGIVAFECRTQGSKPVNPVRIYAVEVAVVVKPFDVLCHESLMNQRPLRPRTGRLVQLTCVNYLRLDFRP